MRAPHVFALPCQVMEDGDRDGFPNVLAESMAMGVPVVSTAISGIPEMIDDGVHGLLVEPRDPAGAGRGAAPRARPTRRCTAAWRSPARQRICERFDSRRTTRRAARSVRRATAACAACSARRCGAAGGAVSSVLDTRRRRRRRGRRCAASSRPGARWTTRRCWPTTAASAACCFEPVVDPEEVRPERIDALMHGPLRVQRRDAHAWPSRSTGSPTRAPTSSGTSCCTSSTTRPGLAHGLAAQRRRALRRALGRR